MPYTFTIGNRRYENKTFEETQQILRDFSHIARNQCEAEAEDLRYYLQGRVEYPFASSVVSLFSSESPPEAMEFVPLFNRLSQAIANTNQGNLTLALQDYEFVTKGTARIHQQLLRCTNASVSTGNRIVTVLEFVAAASAVTVGVIAGLPTAAGGLALEGVSAATLTAGYGAAQATARQASEVHCNLRDRIDWVGIGNDAIINIILNYFGGRLASNIAAGMALSPAILAFEQAEQRAVTSAGQRFLSNEMVRNAVASVLVNRSAGVVQTILRNTIDFFRASTAAQRPTWESVLNQITDNFTISQVFFDLVTAEINRRYPSATAAPTASSHH